jgi:hypothetical protein
VRFVADFASELYYGQESRLSPVRQDVLPIPGKEKCSVVALAIADKK